MKTLGFHRIVASLALAFSLVIGTPAAMAQDAAATEQVESVEGGEAVEATSGYTPMAPTEGKGMPVAKGWDIQPQYSKDGEYAYGLHIGLIWVMAVISAFVLFLLLYVVVRFRKSANPVASKTSHNTLIEVIWTIVPALILVVIALPSITLIARQYETAPKDAITIKAIGYQWYWGYAYPDNGDFEIVSNMLSDEEAAARGEPNQLAVDNRMVVPVGVPIRLQVTAADVIHSFAVPSLWFKMDAVPGRINQRKFQIDKPGVYYGQCSELCGARHGYMPIAVEALPMDEYNAWVLAQGGTIKEQEGSAEEIAESAADAAAAGDAEGVAEAVAAE